MTDVEDAVTLLVAADRAMRARLRRGGGPARAACRGIAEQTIICGSRRRDAVPATWWGVAGRR